MCLVQEHNKRTANLPAYLHTYLFFMLNVKQGNCECQLLKSFGLTPPGNRTSDVVLKTGLGLGLGRS